MSVIALLLVLALIGLVAYMLVTMIPMPAQIQKLIIITAVVIGALYVLNALGVGLPNARVPQIK